MMSYKAARVNAGYSQEKAAKLLNVGRMTLSSWETGKTDPGASDLANMVKLYNVPIEELNIFLRSTSV